MNCSKCQNTQIHAKGFCKEHYYQQWKENNIQKLRKYKHEYYLENKDEIRKKNDKWIKDNKIEYMKWKKEWKKSLKERFKYNIRSQSYQKGLKKSTCETCGTKKRLEIHHKTYTVFDVITLCIPCHKSIHEELKQQSLKVSEIN